MLNIAWMAKTMVTDSVLAGMTAIPFKSFFRKYKNSSIYISAPENCRKADESSSQFFQYHQLGARMFSPFRATSKPRKQAWGNDRESEREIFW